MQEVTRKGDGGGTVKGLVYRNPAASELVCRPWRRAGKGSSETGGERGGVEGQGQGEREPEIEDEDEGEKGLRRGVL